MGIFGKLAYDEGATVGTLLAVRFVLAAALFWVLVLATGGGAQLRALPRRDVGIALALGAVGYSAQAGAYFAALAAPRRVAALAAALHVPRDGHGGRDRARARAARAAATAVALVLASAGLVLVLAGAGAGALDPRRDGARARRPPSSTATYILTSEGVAARVGPLAAQRAGLHRRRRRR